MVGADASTPWVPGCRQPLLRTGEYRLPFAPPRPRQARAAEITRGDEHRQAKRGPGHQGCAGRSAIEDRRSGAEAVADPI